jgi:hypothetical protein
MVQHVFSRVNTDAQPPPSAIIVSTPNPTADQDDEGTSAIDGDTENGTAEPVKAVNGEENHKKLEDRETEEEANRQSLKDEIIAEAAQARLETVNGTDNSKSPAEILGDTEQVFEDHSVPEALAVSSVQATEEDSSKVPTAEVAEQKLDSTGEKLADAEALNTKSSDTQEKEPMTL